MHNNNAVISLADRNKDTINQLTSLWIEAFGDDENFIRDFIDCYLIPEYNVPVVSIDNKIISALYLIDFDLYAKTNYSGTGSYLFAAATREAYKNKGYMSKLIHHTLELYENRGCEAVFLFPQNESLFKFYANFGFKPAFNCQQLTVGKSSESLNSFIVENLKIDDREIFEELYNLYASKTIKNVIAPLKDKQFYFKCAKSYIGEENIDNTSEYRNFFGLIKNVQNIEEKFCYIFYRISENSIQIDDITLTDTKLNKENSDSRRIVDIIYCAFKNSFDIENKKLILTLDEFNGNSTDNADIDTEYKSIAMMYPLNPKTANVTDNIIKCKSPNYINMFMNY